MAATPFPDRRDREAVRQWLRDNASGERTSGEVGADDLAVSQQQKLLRLVNEEPRAHRLRQQLDVALTGPATEQHTVAASVLGKFLVDLQESVSSVAQALTGQATSRAPIPGALRLQTALEASAVFPSSFGVTLLGPVEEPAQGNLFPEFGAVSESLIEGSISTVLDLVDLSESGGVVEELLTDRLFPLGPRTTKHLQALTSGLADSGLGVRATWRSSRGVFRRSQWSAGGVRRVLDLCNHSDFSEVETMHVVGWLGGASQFRNSVEIRTDGNELLRASISADMAGRLRDYFDERVEADLEVARVRYTGGRERTLYSVIGLRRA